MTMLMIAGSSADPLLSDDLAILLAQFPNAALRLLLDGMGKHTAIFQYGDARAAEVRALPEGSDLRPHATAIADEVRWWASNSLHLGVGQDAPSWTEIARLVAEKNGAELKDELANAPAWRVEQLLLERLTVKWKSMTDEQRAKAMGQPGMNVGVVGGATAIAGGGVMAFAEGAAALVLSRAAPSAAAAALPAAAVMGPLVALAGTAWAIYGFAGPSHRVLGPAVALIALTRQALRDQRVATAFRED